MNTTMVTQYWLEGFAEAAEKAGVAPEQVPELLKVAQRLQAMKAHPKAFQAGVDMVVKGAQAAPAGNMLSRLVSRIKGRLPSRLGIGLGMGLGAAALYGGGKALGGAQRGISDMQELSDADQYRQDYARAQSRKAILNSLPGMSPVPYSPYLGSSLGGSPFLPV